MKIKLLTILIVFAGFKSLGQDVHFSQFNSAPSYLNPALTGLFKGMGRVILNHRNQWNTVTVPFVTFAGSYDMNLTLYRDQKDVFGLGINFLSDKAGDSNLSLNQFNLAGSYSKSLSIDKTMFLTMGFQTGYAQRSLSYQKLTFANQFNGDVFDKDLSGNESLLANKVSYFDASFGTNFFVSTAERKSFNIGLAAHHLNQPRISFANNADVMLPARFVLHTSAQLQVTQFMDFIPSVVLQRQGVYTQLLAGAYSKFILNEHRYDYKAFSLGYFYRAKNKDAIILMGKIDYKSISFGTSYDINISDLAPASYNNGGYEFFFSYIFNYDANFKMKKYPCPSF